jgi:hypothetical protein
MTDTTPPDPTNPDLRPGDEAPEGTEGAGENLCPKCGGSGKAEDGGECPVCVGTGRVVEGVGGA